MTLVKTHAGPIALSAGPDGLALVTPYDPLFLADFKTAIPTGARRWDGGRKEWIVDPAHGPKLQRLILAHYNVELELPTSDAPQAPVTVTEVLQLAYLGGCREREDRSVSASGYVLGNRNAKAPDLTIPEATLKTWFKVAGTGATPGTPASSQPAAPDTLYAVLGVSADADDEGIKRAYRRMARQTHPDVNKEPDAAEQFRRLQAAYDVLRDPLMRRKYAAGLKLAERFAAERDPKRGRFDPSALGHVSAYAPPPQPFRAPLRCGLLLVQGVRRLGRLQVETILSWEDLTRDGRVLVSSWPSGADCWLESWVEP